MVAFTAVSELCQNHRPLSVTKRRGSAKGCVQGPEMVANGVR